MVELTKNTFDWHELSVIMHNAERREIELSQRLQLIIDKLLKWRDDIDDQRATSIEVEIHLRGKSVTASVRKLDME